MKRITPMTRRAFRLTLLALGASAHAATVDVAFIGGSTHDPDGAEFGIAAAQTGFFRLTVASSGAGMEQGASFFTFRLDMSPVIQEGLHAFSVGDSVTQFGSAGLQPAPIASQTAFLYSQFLAGALSAQSGFTVDSEADLDALQDAIWHFQGLFASMPDRRGDSHALDPLADESTATLSARAQSFVDMANAAVSSGEWNGVGAVRVLSATAIGPNAGADQGTNFLTVAVPLPGAAGLTMGSLMVLGARRRRLA